MWEILFNAATTKVAGDYRKIQQQKGKIRLWSKNKICDQDMIADLMKLNFYWAINSLIVLDFNKTGIFKDIFF